MRNIWTIARKELRGYFDHPTAYILLVVFLAINLFFYFRSAFLIGQASLRPMFELLPWILLFFVPAVTMGSLAEEKRHGTLEVVLSQPIREHDLLIGKYVGDVLFVAIALAGTLLAPLTLTLGGSPDFGVVIAQYFGSLLLVAGMTAVGLFASALTRNQITAFIVGTASVFVLMMAGTEVVQMGLPTWVSGAVGQLAILPHFANVTRGVIDLRDLVYFAAVAVAFLALAYWLLARDRLSHKGALYRNLKLGTGLLVAIAVVANLFGSYIPGRIDLTAEQLYTLSDGTKQILRNLNDVVTITFFTSRELPAQVQVLERDVSDVLRDFERYSRGNVQVIRKHPDRSEQAAQEAQQLGIQPVQFNVVRREELQVKQGWLGLAVQYADQSEVIPFVRDNRTLEYQLASNVWRLTRTSTPKVAFASGHGEKTQTDYARFTRELRQTYDVTTVDLSSDTAVIEPDVDALIIAGPKRALDARARERVRSYLASDGRLLYLGDGVDVNLQYLFAMALPDSVRDLTRQFGVQLNGDLVFDVRSNESIQVPGEVFNYIVAYPFWLRALPVGEHAITRNINSIFLPWASSLDTLATVSGRTFTPLLATSEFASHQVGNLQIRPDQELAYDPEQMEQFALAVAVQGAVRSDMVKGETATEPDGGTDGQVSGAMRGRVVVVGDADFLADQFVGNAPEGVLFALNSIDWLTQTEALLGIRSKQPTPRPLVFESNFEMLLVKYLNLIGVPLAFVLLGAGRLLSRRRKTRRKYGE
ncbi:MAG: Gldg family protein [Gemmatimonadales bacterium]|jgi:ABC-2 type transport system permease protein